MNPAGPFSGPAPRWFTIQAHRPFLSDVARGLLQALPGDALADAVVLLPTRRAARALAEAFVEASGGRALLLPQVRALGDLEEGEPPFEPGDLSLDLPASIGSHRRRFELARIVKDHEGLLGRGDLTGAAALELADALGALIDSLEIEEVPKAGRGERLEALVEGELAEHWQVSARFLKAALQAWPARLDELGLVDPADRRVRLLRALAGKWSARPPEGPMLAAGSTGTAPANAALLSLIATLPQGAVVLPGLDTELADSAWAEVGDQHPQHSMKRLLERAGVGREAVTPWPVAGPPGEARWRRRLINEALRPPEATADWARQIAHLRQEGEPLGVDPIAEGVAGLHLVTAQAEEEAATVIALLLREVLETPGRTAALITPDQALARRVSARLERWNVEADSSAGRPLGATPVGVLAGLLAEAVLDPADPVRLLAIVKHPLVALGMLSGEIDAARRALERHGVRGPRRAGADWIERRLQQARRPRPNEAEAPAARLAEVDAAEDLLRRVAAAFALAAAPFETGEAAPSEAARGLAMALEALAAQPGGGVGGLWSGFAGEAAAGLLGALIHEAAPLAPVRAADFASMLRRLMEQETVRSTRAAHDRLKILGAIEARLVTADRLILAGLEEGVWPQGAPIDPFLSRPMREAFGLPPPERRIGLAAHDFAQAAAAEEVYLVHSRRRDGAPAVESRWLWRLRTVARGADVALPDRPQLLDWTRALDAPECFRPAARPRPAPPPQVRPTELPVTGVETWLRDPYAIYARYVLRLRPLERPGEPVEARARGEAIHRAFQRFAERHPDALPERAHEVFEALLIEALQEAGMTGPAMARERALAAQAAPWVIAFERARRPGARLVIEQQGRVSFLGPAGEFTVTARADRIELRDGRADVLDFKTGAPPSRKQVEADFAPQLTLTAAILARGGFPEVEAVPPGELLYVQVTGRTNQKDPRPVAEAGESVFWAERAFEGLTRRVARFQSATTAYVSWAAPQFMNERGGDYDHLARVWEWHVIGEGEEGGE